MPPWGFAPLPRSLAFGRLRKFERFCGLETFLKLPGPSTPSEKQTFQARMAANDDTIITINLVDMFIDPILVASRSQRIANLLPFVTKSDMDSPDNSLIAKPCLQFQRYRHTHASLGINLGKSLMRELRKINPQDIIFAYSRRILVILGHPLGLGKYLQGGNAPRKNLRLPISQKMVGIILRACKEITSLFKVHSFVKNLSKDIISLILIFFLKF
jgi:hypothetical protein